MPLSMAWSAGELEVWLWLHGWPSQCFFQLAGRISRAGEGNYDKQGGGGSASGGWPSPDEWQSWQTGWPGLAQAGEAWLPGTGPGKECT